MSLIKFVFQNGEFISDPSNIWIELLKSIIGPLIGGLISFWIAWFIFSRTTRTRREEEIQLKERHQRENLKYFQSFVNKISRTVIQMSENFNECIKRNEQNTVSFFPNNFTPLNDLDRLVNKVDQEKMYHSYINFFGESENTIKDFILLFSFLDFFHMTLNVIQELISDRVTQCYKSQLEYEKITREARMAIAVFSVNRAYINSHGPLIIKINALLQEILESKVEDVAFYQKNFVLKMCAIIMEDSKTIPDLQSIYLKLVEASILFNKINADNIFEIRNLKEKVKGLEDTHKEFIEKTVALRKTPFDLAA